MGTNRLHFLQNTGALRFAAEPANEGGSGEEPNSADESGEKPGEDESLGEGGKKALVAERDARKQAEKDRDAAQARLKELEDAGKSDSDKIHEDNEKLRTQLAEITQERDALVTKQELAEVRTEVLDAKEVPERLRKWVTGSTKEELETSADEALADFREENPMRTLNPRKRETTPKNGVSAGGDLYDQLHGNTAS